MEELSNATPQPEKSSKIIHLRRRTAAEFVSDSLAPALGVIRDIANIKKQEQIKYLESLEE